MQRLAHDLRCHLQLFDFARCGKRRFTHFNPEALRMCVIVIDALNKDIARRQKAGVDAAGAYSG